MPLRTTKRIHRAKFIWEGSDVSNGQYELMCGLTYYAGDRQISTTWALVDCKNCLRHRR